MSRKHARSTRRQSSRVRIIAGQWRGRWIGFDEAEGLRPTGDRIRETLFNWLQTKTPGSRCLDLYAGSGALGIEAASRGAGSVVMVDNNPGVITRLRGELEKLDIGNIELVLGDAQCFLQREDHHAQYDLVFIDPPFADASQIETLSLCRDSQILAASAWVYLEAVASAQIENQLPPGYVKLKSRRSGNVQYLLLEYQR